MNTAMDAVPKHHKPGHAELETYSVVVADDDRTMAELLATNLRRLGHRVQFAGRVGDDPLGQVVEEACRAHGIEGHLGRDAGSFTGVLVRDMQTSRPTIVGYARSGSAGSRLAVEDLAGCAVRDARVLHTTGITAVLSPQSLETVKWALAAAHGAGTWVSFDPNLRWRLMHPVHTRPVLASLLGNVDVLLVGGDELVWLADREDVDEATAWALDERGHRNTAFTK